MYKYSARLMGQTTVKLQQTDTITANDTPTLFTAVSTAYKDYWLLLARQTV